MKKDLDTFIMWGAKGYNKIYCKVCNLFPGIVLRTGKLTRLPAITKKEGTQHRQSIVQSHLDKAYHLDCLKAYKLQQLREANKLTNTTTLDKMVSKSNEDLANKIGNLCYNVFNDGKRLTLSAYSWPTRVLCAQLGAIFNINNPAASSEQTQHLNLQYLNPKMHAEIMTCIVESDDGFLRTKIENSLAFSIRVDGSCDRTNIDKIYILGKIVNERGELELLFMGIGVQKERYAVGLHKAIKTRINEIAPNFYETCLKKVSSVVTDGASINVGEVNGLWALIDNDFDLMEGDNKQTIWKIWCSAHRADLVVKDLFKKVPEVDTLIRSLSKISSYFHKSPMRTEHLKRIAADNNLKLMRLPNFYEVRWCEFVYTLLDAILTSWQCLMLYFNSSTDIEGIGYGNLLKNFEKFKMITFIADILFVFKRFQKKIQADDINIVSLQRHLDCLKSGMVAFDLGPIIGAWESKLLITIRHEETPNGSLTCSWNGVQLDMDEIEKRGQANKIRVFTFLRKEVLNHFKTLLNERFEFEKKTMQFLTPFIKFDRNKADIDKIHKFIGADLNLASLSVQFNEICDLPEVRNMDVLEIISYLANSDNTASYKEILTVFSRLAAATPHSADCERTISGNNLLKTNIRSSIDIATENEYLYIHFNMPPVIAFDPRKTVVHWLNMKQRRSHDLIIEHIDVDNRKTKNQPYFKGFFSQQKRVNESDCENEPSAKRQKC